MAVCRGANNIMVKIKCCSDSSKRIIDIIRYCGGEAHAKKILVLYYKFHGEVLIYSNLLQKLSYMKRKKI